MRRARAVCVGALILALCLAAGLTLRRWGVGLLRISGSSMNDTLMDGDVALVTRFGFAGGDMPQRGDVVECRLPGRGETYVKRVIALPGDAVVFSGGALTVNGYAVPEPYVSSPTDDFDVLLGEDEYLVLGDNRQQSYDSRMPDIGPVSEEAFLGIVRWIVWPPARMGAAE